MTGTTSLHEGRSGIEMFQSDGIFKWAETIPDQQIVREGEEATMTGRQLGP